MSFKLRSEIVDVELIAVDRGIRELRLLERAYGPGRWRKLKGKALVEFADGSTSWVELHWYEAHGIGRRDVKIKRPLKP